MYCTVHYAFISTDYLIENMRGCHEVYLPFQSKWYAQISNLMHIPVASALLECMHRFELIKEKR